MKVEFPDWMERFQTPRVLAAGAALILVLVGALAWTAWRWNIALNRLEMMQAQAAVGFLQPPSSTQTLLINPRGGSLTGIDAGGLPKRIDLSIAVISSRYARFRIALSRDDGTSILHTERLAPDSNGNLHLGFNTTLLPDGIYRLRIEGYTKRGELEKYAESRLSVGGR